MKNVPPLKVVSVTTRTPAVDDKGDKITGPDGADVVDEKTEHILVPQRPPQRIRLNHTQRRVRAAQQRKMIKKAKKIMKARAKRAKIKLKTTKAEVPPKVVERTQQIENGEDRS